MKKLFLLSLLASAALIFAGCDKEEPVQPEEPNQEQPAPEDPEPDPEPGKITLKSDEALTFTDEAGSQEIKFDATLEWTASASESFVTVSPASGEKGEATVTVTVAANEAYDPRTATVTLTCGEDTKTILITQKQKGALLLTESTLTVAPEGGKVTIVAKANSNVTATVPEAAKNWITEVKTKGLVDYNFEFEVAANESEYPRVGQIVFTNESGSETITIEQAGAQPKVTEITSAAELIAFISSYNNGEVPVGVTIKNDFSFSDEENAAFQSINNLAMAIDGNNCTISNFNSGKPLATEVASTGAISNLTIAGATALEGGEADKYVATFAGVHAGVISNCTNKVCYTVAGTQTAGTLYVGGFAGKMAAGSEVANSTSEASFYVTTGTEGAAYIGAVAGYNEGAIKNCVVNPVADEAKPSQMCGNDDGRQATGTVLVTGTTLMNSWIGGVAGRAASSSVIEGCTNNADITTNFYKGDANPLLNYVAGITGENAGKVLSCTNNGPLSLYSAETTRYSAGVVGLNTEGAAVKDCSNTADIINGNSGAPSYAANETYTGGIIAVNESTDVANITNSGALKIERMKTDETALISMGGCFGELKVALNGNNQISNSGSINWTETKNCSSTIGYAIGGVAGRLYGSLTGVSNTGNVVVTAKTQKTTGQNVFLGGIAGVTCGAGQITMSNNTNTGNVQFDAQPVTSGSNNEKDKDNIRTYKSIYVGGILGYNPEAALTIENCSNSGYVHSGINDKHTKTANKYIGGIVGYLKGASAVKSCTMTGAIYNDDFNNNAAIADGASTGGIVGVAEGADGARIVVDKCTVDPAAPVKDREVAARRGWFGGVIGHASYTDVTECSVNSLMSGSFYFSGGVCGEMIASTVKQCTVDGDQTSSQTYYAGGLVGKMDGTSSLDNSSVRGTITSSSANARSLGSLVAEADSGASVTNCKYKVTFTVSKATPTTGVIAVAAEGVIQSGNTELTE